MHRCNQLELMPDVTAHTLKAAAQHISGRLWRKSQLAFTQLQQLELNFFRKALVLDVLQAKPLDQFASIEVPHGGMGSSIASSGCPFARSVASAFDTYLAAGVGRHSVAV